MYTNKQTITKAIGQTILDMIDEHGADLSDPTDVGTCFLQALEFYELRPELLIDENWVAEYRYFRGLN